MSISAGVSLIVGIALFAAYGAVVGFAADEHTGRRPRGVFYVIAGIAFAVGLATYTGLERTLGRRPRFPYLDDFR